MNRNLLIAAGLLLTAATGYTAEYPHAKITNGVVQANIYLPDSTTGFYRGSRFDWSGVVSDLEYAGHNFYPQWFERMDPAVRDFTYDGTAIVASRGTAITGTPEEFKVLGFDEAKAGGTFIKIGVGVLRKPDDQPYGAFRDYEIVDGGKWTVKKNANSVEFTQVLSDPATGYAYTYRKVVSLTRGKPQMVLSHSLRNTGKKAIESNVYDHNFLFLDHQPPSPDFKVTFPFTLKSDPPATGNVAELRDNQIVFLKTFAGEDRAFFMLQGSGSEAKAYDIRVENSKVNAGVRITADRPLSHAMFWAIRAPLAVEPFIDVNAAPGEEFTRKITYDYDTLPKKGD